MENEQNDVEQLQNIQAQNSINSRNEKANRNIANNAHNVQSAADLASKSANPYAKAAGTAIKAADKLSDGKASQSLGKTIDKVNKFSPGGRLAQMAMNKMSESGTSSRIGSALSKKNTQMPKAGQAKDAGKGLNANTKDKKNDFLSRKEVEDETSDGGSAGAEVTAKIIKVAMIALPAVFPVIIFCCLLIAASNMFINSISLGMADSMSDDQVENKIKENEKNWGDEINDDHENLEVDDDSNEEVSYSIRRDMFLTSEDSKYIQVRRQYNEADLSDLNDFYGGLVNFSENINMNVVYDFYFKLYYLYLYYEQEYNVNLDLPLLMSTLNINLEDKTTVFTSNIIGYDEHQINVLKQNNERFSYYKEHNYISTPTSGEYDMEVLAQHMVSRQVTETCTDASGAIVSTNVLKDNQIGTQTLFCGENESYSATEEKFVKDDEKYKEFLKGFIEKKYFINGDLGSNINLDYRNWKQCGASWSNLIVPKSNETMCSIGCLITSVSIQIAKSGTETKVGNFDPGIAMNSFSFVDGGNFIWDSARNFAPNFIYKTSISLVGMNKANIIRKLNSYDSNKYYIVLHVARINSSSPSHFVAMDYVNESNNDIYMIDPASNEINLYNMYKIYTAHIYEKRI